MKKAIGVFLLLFVAFGASSFRGVPASLLGNTVSDFRLKDTNGRTFSLNGTAGAKGFIVVFTCNHCPFAKLYPERLNALSKKYSALGVPLIAVNSMDTLVYEDETLAKMKERAAAEHYDFPYLQDPLQNVARDFKANRTPHAFVIWKENNSWVIRYAGAIDNNGKEPEKATPYLANAVDELLAGKTVKTGETASIGCTIYFRK